MLLSAIAATCGRDSQAANVVTHVEEADLRISRYVSQWGVGVYLTNNRNETDESVLSRIKPYLKPLREETKGRVPARSTSGAESLLEIDTRDRSQLGSHGRLAAMIASRPTNECSATLTYDRPAA